MCVSPTCAPHAPGLNPHLHLTFLARAGALTTDDQERWIREIPLSVMFFEGLMQAPSCFPSSFLLTSA